MKLKCNVCPGRPVIELPAPPQQPTDLQCKGCNRVLARTKSEYGKMISGETEYHWQVYTGYDYGWGGTAVQVVP